MIYLIDYENVANSGLCGIENLTEKDELIFFYNQQSTLNMNTHRILETLSAKKQYIQVTADTKNALDFQLASYLGYLANTNRAFFIVSNDTGYDALISFWKGRNVKIERVSNLAGESSYSIRRELTALFAGKEDKEEYDIKNIAAIIGNYKTKSGINNALVKTYGNTKAGVIYKTIKPLLGNKKGK